MFCAWCVFSSVVCGWIQINLPNSGKMTSRPIIWFTTFSLCFAMATDQLGNFSCLIALNRTSKRV